MPEDNPWTLIFAGTADIDESNLTALLDHWLPADLEVNPPVIQDDPGRPAGLQKVHAYLEDQFGDDAIQHVPSIIDYVMNLPPGPDQYLVTLWDDKDVDEDTEKLVDQASQLNITVLSLTHGLDELKLDNKPPEQPPTVSRAARRRTGTIAQAAAQEDSQPREAQEHAAAEALVTEAEINRAVAEALNRFIRAGLKELEDTSVTITPVTAPATEVAAAPKGDRPAQATPGTQYPADADVKRPPDTRRYDIDPATSKYHYRRGRPKSGREDWGFAYLTPEQEQELGLTEPPF